MGNELDVLAWFDPQLQDALTFLEQLVNVNSHTFNPGGVDEVQGLVAAQFEALGMTVKLVDHPGYGKHLIATTEAVDRSSQDNILLVGHADTVFEFDSAPRTFRVEGDWAYGDGVADDKGGLIAIVWALRALHQQGLLHKVPVIVYSNSQEEDPDPIPERVAESFRRVVKQALIFEPGRCGDCVITRRRGIGRFELLVFGRRAHAGNDHSKGRSAIVMLARLITAISAMTDYSQNVTVNVGTIQGGTAPNVVPGRARATFEVRTADAAHFRDVRSRLLALVQSAEFKSEGVRVQLRTERTVNALEETPASRALFESYRAHAARAGLDYGVCDLVGGGSDANFLASLDIPCIDGLGPYGEDFHSGSERLFVPSIAPKIANLAYWLAGQLREQ